MSEAFGYVYPNHEVFWGILIVIYPYFVSIITGMVTIYAISEFWRKELKPLEKMILVGTFPFVLSALLPLLLDLGQPQRAFEIYVTPNFSSVMAVFGIVYLTELFAILGELWFVYRVDFIWWSQTERNPIKKLIYKILTLGVYDISRKAIEVDHKIIKVLTFVELIAAWCLSYVSFLFGVVKSNPWWNTTILPVSFVFGGLAAGGAMVLILYLIFSSHYGKRVDEKIIDIISNYVFFFLLAAFALEMINTILYAYKEDVAWAVIRITSTELAVPMAIAVIGSLEALLFLRYSRMVSGALKQIMVGIASVSVLIAVFALRWNMVIGAQLVDYSLRGYVSYTPPLFGKEGVLAALLVLAAPFVLMAIVNYFLPPYEKEVKETEISRPTTSVSEA
ncbi:Polysulphide reductase NrfD [Ferroglobus placidus DSM 10642]|uniref:Polysulphide reductase NrfD n=1 Tax=Ferroglobus placidus (strain DSM 10642 / AEDII12DO) TaxID=589924 RepID=D3RY60_FERPA|nr:NrfD/PsrC family molybdoenzyme membrane anchor subunit [Ferroglobus placidus]ADC65423.1 Polysulphide reductase NrfD [Ferroglobus placidus DSM 10642]